MLERLKTIANGEGTLGTSPGNERRWQDGPWANVTDSGMCMGAGCETSHEVTQEQGMILPNGQLLCRVCHEKWAAHVCRELGLARGPRCAKDDNGQCLSCTFEDKEARSKLRHLMIRAQLRDLCHRLFRQLIFLESTFIDQNNPKRQTAGPRRGSPKLDLSGLV